MSCMDARRIIQLVGGHKKYIDGREENLILKIIYLVGVLL